MRTLSTITTTVLYLAQSLVSPVWGQDCSSVTDIDGNVYPVVTIGTQCWMAENLRTAHYRDGTPIPNVTDNNAWTQLNTGAWCNYDNDPANDATYGKLYNWYAVDDARGLCPQGWHVSTDAEWTQLTDHLGGGSVAGGPMKTIGNTDAGTGLWRAPNTGATNASGFSGLPGGYRNYNGTFYDLGYYGNWYSASSSVGEDVWYRTLYYNYGGISRYANDGERQGFCVRCLRDLSIGMAEEEPTHFTLAPNPAHSTVTIGFASHAQPRHLILFEATGRTVLEQPVANTTGPITLDLTGHESGMYVVQVLFADGTRSVERVVKE